MAFEQIYEDQFTSHNHPRANKPITYRGFLIQQNAPYCLFGIVVREGYDLLPMLSGNFTSVEKLKAKINLYFVEHPSATAESAYVERPKKRGRGRPKKIIVTERVQDSSV